MRVLIKSDDFLILRDGRPFGEVGLSGGFGLQWPTEQSLAGMVRSKIGRDLAADFFQHSENQHSIMQVAIGQIMPMLKDDQSKWQCLAPLPADMVITQQGDQPGQLSVGAMRYRTLSEDSGSDIAYREWLMPTTDVSEKRAHQMPYFLKWDFFAKYLQDDATLDGHYPFNDIGISAPVQQTRVHNALDPRRLTVEEGRLFANKGFYLKHLAEKKQYQRLINDLGIAFTIDAADFAAQPGVAYLGGERKNVSLEATQLGYPPCPSHFANKKFLKVILMTHGDFGGWAPSWLCPDLTRQSNPWVQMPGTPWQMRLRSAAVLGWEGISGWDYRLRQPKALRKLVRPGTVYIIEVAKPEESQAIAQALWGLSLETSSGAASDQRSKDGYNQVVVGNVRNVHITA